MSSGSRFNLPSSPTFKSENEKAKKVKGSINSQSQSNLKLKNMALNQLRQIFRSPNRGALVYNLGKDLLFVFRYLPLQGIMNKFQQQKSSSASSSNSNNNSSNIKSYSLDNLVRDENLKSNKNILKDNNATATENNNILESTTSKPLENTNPDGKDKKDDNNNNNKKSNTTIKINVKDLKRKEKYDLELVKIIEANLQMQNIESRTKYLISTISKNIGASSTHNMVHYIEDFYSHIYQYSESRAVAYNQGAVKILLKVLKYHGEDLFISNKSREALAILGYNPPVKGNGVKILSIDGGGVRGLVALETLKMIEKITGKQIYQLFDYICGVSTGSLIAFLLGAQRRPLSQCELLYKDLSKEIFGTQSSFFGTSSLLWSHGYYSTSNWEKVLRKNIGEGSLLALSRDQELPRVSAISTVVNQERVVPYVFRTYGFPPGVRPRYTGGFKYSMWEACRASAAAPTYFEEIKLGNYIHQDGGVLVNNPTSIALSESKTIWGPNTKIQCIVSLGTGLTLSSSTDINISDFLAEEEEKQEKGISSLSWKGKFLKILDSATDTESVHNTLNELIPPSIYFRFNPFLKDVITMDECRPEKLEQLQEETREYLVRNYEKVNYVSQVLSKEKGVTKKFAEWFTY